HAAGLGAERTQRQRDTQAKAYDQIISLHCGLPGSPWFVQGKKCFVQLLRRLQYMQAVGEKRGGRENSLQATLNMSEAGPAGLRGPMPIEGGRRRCESGRPPLGRGRRDVARIQWRKQQALPGNSVVIALLAGPTPQRPVLLIEPDRRDRAVSAFDDLDLVAHASEFGTVPFGNPRRQLQ